MFHQLDNLPSLKPNQFLAILNNCITSPPKSKALQLLNQPKPNENFIYFCPIENDDLFKADGYRWRYVGSRNSTCGVKTNHYYIVTPPESSDSSKKAGHSTEFKKSVYSFTENGFGIGRPVLISYTGNVDVIKSFPHGNSKNPNSYVPTLPSVLKKIKDNALTKTGITKTYMSMVNLHGVSDGKTYFKMFKNCFINPKIFFFLQLLWPVRQDN